MRAYQKSAISKCGHPSNSPARLGYILALILRTQNGAIFVASQVRAQGERFPKPTFSFFSSHYYDSYYSSRGLLPISFSLPFSLFNGLRRMDVVVVVPAAAKTAMRDGHDGYLPTSVGGRNGRNLDQSRAPSFVLLASPQPRACVLFVYGSFLIRSRAYFFQSTRKRKRDDKGSRMAWEEERD